MTERLLRVPEVLERTGFCRSTLYNKIKAGGFPAPKELGANSVAFASSEVDAWIDSRPRRAYGRGA
jgi:prophage regulatory protein